MKKAIFGFVLAVLFAFAGGAGVAAQDNMVTIGGGGGLGIPVAIYVETFASFERQIIPEFSIGVNAAFQLYPLAVFALVFTDEPYTFGYLIDAQAHWYPGGGGFHLDFGGGYSYYMLTMHCAAITSGLGWRFLLGSSESFVLNLGIRTEIFVPIGKNIFEDSDRNARLTPVHIGPHLSLGGAF